MTSIRFEDENFPTKSWQNLREVTREDELQAIDAVGKLFEQRPLWTRHAIQAVLNPELHKHLSK
jgi:hypothetical protein